VDTAIKETELNEEQRRGRIILDDALPGLPDFLFDSDEDSLANNKPYSSLTFVPGLTAVSWDGATQELAFGWSRLFCGGEIAHSLTAVLAQDFGLDPANIAEPTAPKYSEGTIAVQHPPGGASTFVHTRVRLCPVRVDRTVRTVSVPLFEKLRILEGVTISLHPFVAHVIAKDERTSINVSNTAVASAIIREFKLQEAELIQV